MSTYTPVANITLSSAASTVTFGAIPQTYTNLVIVVQNTKTNVSNTNCFMRINNDSSTLYSNTRLETDGSTVASYRRSNDNAYLLDGIGSASGQQSIFIVHLLNYTSIANNKSILSRVSTAATEVGLSAGTYRNISPITSLTFFPTSGNWGAGSTFNIYGINASLSAQAKATGGNEIFRDSTHWYHVFTTSGAFVPNQNVTVDYLVVAGGGSGAHYTGGDAGTGGGGAGGARSTVTSTGGGGALESPLSLLANTSYAVTIGAGGAGVFNADGNNGSNTVFASITSTGGGGGGRWAPSNPGKTGGSGGGSGAYTQVNTGGAGTAGQGYKGGDGSPSPSPGNNSAGGGGGAGAAGANGNNSGTPGVGGVGIWTALTNGAQWGVLSSNNYFVAGGGGSTGPSGGGSFKNRSLGGNGGGGNGGTASQTGSAGLANTGGGGGAQFDTNTVSFAGGSGLVIVRYAV